jgi:hypothetical protein
MCARGGRFYWRLERFLGPENVTAHSEEIHPRFETRDQFRARLANLALGGGFPPNLDSRDSGA